MSEMLQRLAFIKHFQSRTLGEGLVVLLVGILGVTGRLKAFACSGSLAGQ